MAFEVKLAGKLASMLNSVGFESKQANNEVDLPGWSAKIIVVPDKHDANEKGTVLMARIMTFHPSLPRGMAQELSVGNGANEDAAVDQMAAAWMLLFFSALKFVCDARPSDHTVSIEPITLQSAKGAPYRVILGPLEQKYFGQEPAKQPEGITQSMIWDALAEFAQRELGPGVNHLRFYVAVTQAGIEGDVFLNGAQWQAGSLWLVDKAKAFPPVPAPCFGYGVKQHVFVRPDDIAQGAHDRAAHVIGKWIQALSENKELAANPLTGRVLLALDTMSTLGTEAEYETALVSHGVPAELAERLVTFLPCAAIRMHYPTVGYADTYFWANDKTDLAVVKRYDQTAEFLLAMDILKALHAKGLAVQETAWVATISAENDSINEGRRQGVDIASLTFRYMVHMTAQPVDGLPLKGLMEGVDMPGKPGRPWWKLW